jgi:hypothetical protein
VCQFKNDLLFFRPNFYTLEDLKWNRYMHQNKIGRLNSNSISPPIILPKNEILRLKISFFGIIGSELGFEI